MTRRSVFAILALILGVLGPAGLRAQSDVEELAFDRPEAWAMKYFTSIALFTGLGVPRALDQGAMEFGLEGGWVPGLSAAERRVGFNGQKTEDMNKTPAFGRFRATFGLPSHVSFSLGFVPPLDIGGAEPSLFALAVGRPLWTGRDWRIGGRAYGQTGSILGDFTCDEETVAAGPDPVRNPYACEAVSEDEITQQYVGMEVSGGFRRGPWEPYAAVAVNYMDMEFQVSAEYSGTVDSSLLRASGFTVSSSVGVAYETPPGIRFAGEVFATPLSVLRPPSSSGGTEWLINARGMVSYHLR
jgi:hypothetical protein